MLQTKVVVFKKLYKFYVKHFLKGILVLLITSKMLLNCQEFKFYKNYRNLCGTSSELNYCVY